MFNEPELAFECISHEMVEMIRGVNAGQSTCEKSQRFRSKQLSESDSGRCKIIITALICS